MSVSPLTNSSQSGASTDGVDVPPKIDPPRLVEGALRDGDVPFILESRLYSIGAEEQ